ncbi:unnamed protein product [Gongylonema pulchrum]|uniref:Uncharacterized protein n=1 Tax=Gongylonema pulchrum TaxID=637853 RepID=A0A183DRL2_9BILA|nr:unnamed protein product [Gongylonema pulchrum]
MVAVAKCSGGHSVISVATVGLPVPKRPAAATALTNRAVLSKEMEQHVRTQHTLEGCAEGSDPWPCIVSFSAVLCWCLLGPGQLRNDKGRRRQGAENEDEGSEDAFLKAEKTDISECELR